MELVVTQQADGTVTGSWSGKASPPNAPCPPGIGATPSGPVNGTNTVLQVHLSVVGAGDFYGQIADTKTLEGGFVSCGGTYPIIFSLAGPLTAP